jgi:hypothetical protein
MIRVIPDMPRAKAHWVRRTSEFPDYIMVPMSDNTVVMYVPQVTQPGFVKAMENIKRMKVGYEWKGEDNETDL